MMMRSAPSASIVAADWHSRGASTVRCFTYRRSRFTMRSAAWPEPPSDLIAALGEPAVYVGRNQFDYLVAVKSEAALRKLKPDIKRLSALPVRGVIVTARSENPPYDFVSRFFAPAVGVDEDPVTGSAHCCLADYWRKQLDKTEFLAYQASPRGGTIRIRIAGDRVFLGGKAVTVVRGELIA